jgi:hypothetical protein
MFMEGQVDLSEYSALAGGDAFPACPAEVGIQLYKPRFICMVVFNVIY